MTDLNDNGEEKRPLFIDTSFNTHLILVVSPLDTFSHLKQMIMLEHPKCFPEFGDMEVNALKVKRKGIYYHVVESMLIKDAFRGVSSNWFLSVDASKKLASSQTPIDGHVVNPAMMIDPPKLLTNYCHSHDVLVTNLCKTENKSHPEMQKVLAISKVGDECNSSEHSLKRKKRKRKSGDDDVDTRVDSDDHGKAFPVGYEESVATENRLKSAGIDTDIQNSPVKKKPKVANDNEQENTLLDNAKVSDSNRLTCETENVITSDGGDVQKSGLVDLNELLSEVPKTSEVSHKRKKEKRHVVDEPMKLDIEEKEKEKNVSIVADGVSKVETTQGASSNPPEHFNNEKGSDDVGLTSGSQSDMAGVDGGHPTVSSQVTDIPKDKVTGPEKTVHEPLTSTKKEEKDPLKLLEVKSIEESGKKKKSRKSKRSETEKSKIHQDVANDIPSADGIHPNASKTVSDVSKLDVSLTKNENRVEQDSTKGTEPEKTVQESLTEEKEGKKKKSKKSKRSETEKSKICSTENNQDVGNDIQTNGSTRGNVVGSHTTVDVSVVENENRIEQDYTKVTGPEKTVQESLAEEKEGKKKKSRKSKRSETEKSEICSTENNQDIGYVIQTNGSTEGNVVGSHTSVDVSIAENENRIEQDYTKVTEVEKAVQEQPLTPSKTQTEEKEDTGKKKKSRKSKRSDDDNNNRHCLTKEVVDASEADKEKPVNEIVEDGDVVKKKKTKKEKKSYAEENNKLEVTLSSQKEADDVQKVGVQSLLASEIEDVRVECDEIVKRVCQDMTDLSKDHLEHPAEGQVGEKRRDPQSDGDLLPDGNVGPTQRQRCEDRHEERIAAAEISADGAAEVRKPKRSHSTKKAKTRNITSSVDTSVVECDKLKNPEGDEQIKPKDGAEIRRDEFIESTQGKETNVKKPPELVSEKRVDEETSEMVSNSKPAFDGLQENTVDNHSKIQQVSVGKNLGEEFNNIPIPEVSADVSNPKKPLKRKERAKKLEFPSSDSIKPHKAESKQGTNTQSKSARKEEKLSGSSSVSSGGSFRIRERKGNSKPNAKVRSRNPNVEGVDTVVKRKGLLVTPGAIFDDKSDGTSDEGEAYGSSSSTRTPSDYVSSSDYSEDESRGVVVTSKHDSLMDGEKTAGSKMSDMEKLDLGSVFRRSSRYKEAKVIASQIEESESPIEFVPDSQATL